MTERKPPWNIDREKRAARRSAKRSVTRTSVAVRDGSADLSPVSSLTVTREVSVEMAEAETVVARLAQAFKAGIDFHKLEAGGGLSHAEAVASEEEMRRLRRQWAEEKPARALSWSDISAIADVNITDGLAAWRRVCDAADNELESGYRIAHALNSDPDPWTLAQFLAIRSAFADEWQPRGGIEAALIDMLALAFHLQLHWAGVGHERAINSHNEQRKEVARFESMGWKSPFQSAADAIEQAHRLADGYNRQFLRVLRQLRDLRRYAPPVIVNNGGQVNVAANGGQQVNVA